MKCRAFDLLRTGAAGILGLGLLLQCMAGMPTPALAQEEEEIIPIGIPPLSSRVSVLGVPLSVLRDADGDGEIDFGTRPGLIPVPRIQELAEITFIIDDLSGNENDISIAEDFLALESAAETSGLGLYRETLAVPDRFNYTPGDPSNDRPVNLLEPPLIQPDPTNENRVFITFRPVPGTLASQVPIQQTQFASFYLVAQTTINFLQGDTFEVSVPADGIRVRDFSSQPLPKLTAYDIPFPGEEFEQFNPSFGERAIFQGDIITIQNLIRDTDNTNRIDINSEPRTILGIDFAGQPDQDYFIKEVNLNFIGINLSGVAQLIDHLTQGGITIGTFGASQTSFHPTFFYSPYFYNFPPDPDNPGFILTETRSVFGEEVTYPLTAPLDFFGAQRSAFVTNLDNPNAHVTSFQAYGPREFLSSGLLPSRIVNSEVFKDPLPNGTGGVFLFRDVGGTQGTFDEGIDRVIRLDDNGIRVRTFPLTPELVSEDQGIANAIGRLLPALVGGIQGRSTLQWLFQDTNLAEDLLGVPAAVIDEIPPVDPLTEPRPPYGSLECYLDPNCYFFDEIINVARPYLGLTEGQIRYLHSLPENDKINMLELYETELLQAFTYTLPVADQNAIGDLEAPASRTGNDDGPDLYVAVRTSDKMRALDSIIPFIQPRDITVSTNLTGFLAGEETSNLPSVASVGLGRPDSDTTTALIGRPNPRFQFRDLTTPGEGFFASNDNIIFDRSQSSPPKPVVGIDVTDFGQNPTTIENPAGLNSVNFFDSFFTESSVFAELQIDFIPGNEAGLFIPALFNTIPLEVGLSQSFTFPVSVHSVALYVDDDTPSGDGIDNDGDGLIDEEIYNLQDDDADGLIDEDFGDLTPAGINGQFDSQDKFLPYLNDGVISGFTNPRYAFTPNDQTKFEDYITAVTPDDGSLTLIDGGMLPLNVSENAWFTELDYRVLDYESVEQSRALLFPPSGFRPYNPGGEPAYNQGMFTSLDPRQGVLDLFWQVLPDDPYPETFCIEDVVSGETICLLLLTNEGDGQIGIVPAPDPADPLALRTSFLLSMAGALRIPNPSRGFVRVGNVPMTINTPSTNVQEVPGGANQVDPPLYTQFGYFIQTAEPDTIVDYAISFNETLQDAFEQAQELIDQYNEDVADAEANVEPGEEPEYPEPPEPVEFSLPDPYASLGIEGFFEESPTYTTNYSYHLQFPDENFGPLAGDDYFVVLRMSPLATTGDSFRVRIRSGNTNNTLDVVDDDGAVTTVATPAGGFQYMSFVDTDYDEEEPFRGVSRPSVTTRPIVVRSQNVSPRVTFTAPGTSTNLASSELTFEIAYIVEDPDNAPEVRLFIDDNSIGFDGQFLNGSLARPNVGSVVSYTLDMPNQIENFDPTQPYFVYAVVDDGVNTPIFTYADGPILTPASVEDPSLGGGGGGSGGGGSRVITGDVFNPLDYMKLSSDGRTFAFGDFPPQSNFEGTADFVDFEPAPGSVGGIAVQPDGKLFATGDVSIFQSRVQTNQEIIFPADQVVFYNNSIDGATFIVGPSQEEITIESARDVEVDFTRGAIYVLDGDGDMLLLGATANQALVPPAVGLDIYRDMELVPTGDDMYFLTGNGILTRSLASPQEVWMNLVEDVDTYPDIELVTQGSAVRNVIITDNNGDLTILGPDSGNANTLSSLQLLEVSGRDEITPGSIRQVKDFPGRNDVLILVSGGGLIHYLASDDLDQIEIPLDTIVFSDEPGLLDDRVVDVETTNVNLTSVIDSIYEVLDAVSNADTETIVSQASPDYRDRNGADLNGLQSSIRSLFEFYQVASFTQSAIEDSFILNNQGDTITASVTLDVVYYIPTVRYEPPPELDEGAIAPQSSALFLFADEPPAFPQSIRVREVFDGRGWNVEFWEINNFGRLADLIGNENPDLQDVFALQRYPGNLLLGTYAPMSRTVDPRQNIRVSRDSIGFNNSDILVFFREQFIAQDYLPPMMEFTFYTTQFIAVSAAVEMNFEYERQDDGTFLMTSMTLPQILGENSEDLTVFDADLSRAYQELEGLEVEAPFGFSFEDRGPVITSIEGIADFVLTGDSISPIHPSGAVMMLPEGTDIFTFNIETFLDEITRAQVFFNPFDPNQDAQDPGTSSIEPGRAYFVITRDGRHFGLIQLDDEFSGTDLGLDSTFLFFDYRYEESFELPSNF